LKKKVKKKDKLILIGAGEFGEIAYQYFTYDSPYEVVAFSAEQQYIDKDTLFNLPVVPLEELEKLYDPLKYKAFVSITFTQLNRVRTRIYHQVKEKGFQLVSYVSSRAFIWKNVKIGENCFIFEDNVLQYHVEVGNNVVLWSGNHVGHRTKIKDNCFLASHVVISGYCEIGKSCFLGVNCSFIPKINVADDCIIGAGAVVLKNTEEGKVYAGNPAKQLKKSSFEAFNVKEELI
jgi:sugar O-acyltransferase (sialic acid O-acetyltransferase NeuD family)